LTTRRVVSGGNRFLTIGAAAGSLALLAAVVLMLWPPETAEYEFTAARAQTPDGETVGWVSKVESNTIHVNSGPFGGGVVPLVVTKATRIIVGAKEGWFEDIRPGGQVKVAYELYHGRRFARSVELLVDEGARRPPGRGSTPVKGTVDAAAVTGAPDARPAPKAAPSAPVAPAAPATPAPLPTPVVVAPTPEPKPAAAVAKPAPAPEIRPVPRPEPAPVPPRPQPVEIVPPPQRASTTAAPRSVVAPENSARAAEPARAIEAARPPTPAAPRPVEPARSADSEATDGSAAVDWLLKNRR
jgi:hypothetical protein